jgi:hypothetical protein
MAANKNRYFIFFIVVLLVLQKGGLSLGHHCISAFKALQLITQDWVDLPSNFTPTINLK